MNKAQSIQRSKLVSSYGGVGSIIDTIDNLAYIIKPFNEWNIYTRYNRAPQDYKHLKVDEVRLKTRLHCIGFNSLDHFFLPDDQFESISVYNPETRQQNRMVTAKYAPQWFYCERCGSLKSINDWKETWRNKFDREMPEPKCALCATGVQRVRAQRLQQVRFVLASLENGELKDIPWNLLWSAKNGRRNYKDNNGEVRKVWDFRNGQENKDVSFHIKKGGSDLIDIYVKSNGIRLTMAEIMNHYFILDDDHVYQPVIRSANNVYFAYTVSSVYIPIYFPTQKDVDKILVLYDDGINDVNQIHKFVSLDSPNISIRDVEYIIEKRVADNPDYRSEERFLMDEYDYITNDRCRPDARFESRKYKWSDNGLKPKFIKNIYLLNHLEVTTIQVAYSRLERVSRPDYNNMTGETKKQWFDLSTGVITSPDTPTTIGLHPTCNIDRDKIKYMPAVVSRGEGFFVELDLSKLDKKKTGEKKIFTHTFAHLIMKELEFSCGYPLPSMSERLYILPAQTTNVAEDKYGFLIYSANGEAGSYGGITNLFETNAIERILKNAVELADDCPNDPICESENANCFACVQIPETACELFNSELSRKVFKDECRLHFDLFNDRPANQNSGTKSQSSSNDYDECSNNSWENDNSEIESRIKNTANNTGIVPGIVLG